MRFISIVICINDLFLYISETYSIILICHNVIHLPAYVYLGYLVLLATIKKDAMTIWVQVCVCLCMYIHFHRGCKYSELLGSMVNIYILLFKILLSVINESSNLSTSLLTSLCKGNSFCFNLNFPVTDFQHFLCVY